LTGKQLLSVLDAVCKEGTTVATDDFSGYNILDKETKNKYIHVSVNHSLEQFANGDIHTNGMENFWSLVKREYIGPHHHYSVKYMSHYIDEMSFRQNNLKNPVIFETLPGQTVMKKAA
jgi:transposase-like protein